MNNNNTYYQSNKKGLQEQARNCYHQEGGKRKAKYIMKITKRDCKRKHEKNMENYLMKKKI